MKADLHLHTTASDGRSSPEEIVRKAAKRGLGVIAITDHDSTEGIAAALKEAESFSSLLVIPGVEISTDVPNGEVHILGYFIDYHNKELQQALKRLRSSRYDRAQTMIAKLCDLGIHIEWSRVLEIAGGGSVGRPHIAQAMFERGYIPSIQEAFTKYIGYGGPAYAERRRMTPKEAVELISRVNGLPVLAHPADIEDLEAFLPPLKEAGLVGLEAYYNGYSTQVVKRLVQIAEKHGLIPCGGSDFHGLKEDSETPIGGVEIPPDILDRLLALAGPRIKV